MRIRLCSILVAVAAASAVTLAHTDGARASWCWPGCSGHAQLGPGTSSYNGCWYLGGEVCSGWNYWSMNGIDKQCYPRCDIYGYTQALVLYGFENGSTIRGRFTDFAGVFRIRPVDVGMGGYLRAQVNWWPYFDGRLSSPSLIQAVSL